MMTITPINALNKQSTAMSCWAACIAALTHGNVNQVIQDNNPTWAQNGLPPSKDHEIMSGKYGLMKYTPWHHAFCIEGRKGMVANNHHWIVVYGIQRDEHNNIVLYRTWDPINCDIHDYTQIQMDNWGAQVAYCVL